MDILIDRKLGKILDFILHPFYGRFYYEFEKFETFNDLDIEVGGVEELLKELNKMMKNHFEIIDKFNSMGFNPMIDLIGENLLIESNTIEEYLNSALKVNEATLRKNLMKLLMVHIGNKDIIEDAIRANKHMDREHMVSIVKESSISSSMKWNMFCVIEDPIKYIKEYVDFMITLKPNFDKLWVQAEKDLNEYEPIFAKNIEKKGLEFLNSITDEFFDIKNIKDITIVVALSYVSGGSISVFDMEEKMILHWGYKVEEVFNKIKERKEFELEKRVRVIKTLGDKTKYKMLKLIADNPEISASDIINNLNLTGATVSYHTTLMNTYKILKITKENKKNSFEIDKNTLKNVLQGIIEDFELNYVDKND